MRSVDNARFLSRVMAKTGREGAPGAQQADFSDRHTPRSLNSFRKRRVLIPGRLTLSMCGTACAGLLTTSLGYEDKASRRRAGSVRLYKPYAPAGSPLPAPRLGGGGDQPESGVPLR